MSTLAGVLEGYCSVYEDLLALARSKRDILTAGRPQDLEAVVQAEEALLARLGRLDRALADARRSVEAAGAGVPVDATFEELLAVVDPEERRRLEALGDRLRSALEELRGVAEENVSLLRQALTFVQFSINLLEGSAPGTTYAPSGRVARDREPVVDHHA